MNKLLKLAGALAVIVTVLAVAVPASALPPQCEENCSCSARCTTLCAIGAFVTNCGAWGECIGMCRGSGNVVAALEAPAPADEDDALLARILGQPGCDAPAASAASH